MDRPAGAVPALLAIGDFRVDFAADQLRDVHGRGVPLRPQAWAVLRLLAQHRGALVSREQLHEAVWPGLVVTDDSLVQAISDARAALGELGHRVIRTVPRRGYTLAVEEAEPRPKAPDRPSIAVLAFRDPHRDPEGQLLARGVAEELVAELARNADLRVVSHHSSFAFADTSTPLNEIGQRLRSRYLVDGTVRREGEQLRVSVELIDSATAEIVWAARHQADRASLFAERDALVRRIAGTLHNSARVADARSVLERPPKTLDAYALTARAVALRLQLFDPQARVRARELFGQALAIDADYAPAWAYLAELNAWEALSGPGFGDPSVPAARDCRRQAQRALALQADSPMAHRVMSYAHVHAREFDRQLAMAQRAVELAPSNADNLFALAWAHLTLGQGERAVAAIEDALWLHPMPPTWVLTMHANALIAAQRYAEALESADRAIAAYAGDWLPRFARTAALAALGQLGAARTEARRMLQIAPWLTVEALLLRLSDSAVELRRRRGDAMVAAGVPRAAAS